MKYIKTVQVEAWQWTFKDMDDYKSSEFPYMPSWVLKAFSNGLIVEAEFSNEYLIDGALPIFGDYILKYGDGIRLIEKEIFESTYTKLGQHDDPNVCKNCGQDEFSFDECLNCGLEDFGI